MRPIRISVALIVLALASGACNPTAPSPAPSAGPTARASQAAAASVEPSPTPIITPTPPAVTALSAPTIEGSPGRLTVATTLTSAGAPLAAAPVQATITALDATYQVLELEGIVPPAKSVIIGFRFNQEGAGPAPIDLKIYRITYTDGGRTRNQLPNPGFDYGLYRWAVYGTGKVTTPKSDRGDGRMLRLRATATQDISINSFGIPAKPKSTFRMRVAAELPPAGTGTGYTSPIFIMETEVQRLTLDLVAPPIPVLALVTDATGAMKIDQALPPGRYALRIAYAGDATHEPSFVEVEVTVA